MSELSRDVLVRPLAEPDFVAYRALRHAALRDSPAAFSASPEDEEAISDADMMARVVPPAPSLSLGAFAGDDMAGAAAYIPNRAAKLRHKATMVAVYVAPQWRGTGTGRRLVEAIIDHARNQAVILQCTVAAHNTPARDLYRKLGFIEYGLERHALLVGGRYYDEALLAIDLRADVCPA